MRKKMIASLLLISSIIAGIFYLFNSLKNLDDAFAVDFSDDDESDL